MSRLAIFSLIALFVLVGTKIPVWGIAAVEKRLDVYPVISQETVASMDELTAAYGEFSRACFCYKSGAGTSLNGESCEGQANEAALEQAMDHRKAAAAKLNPGLITAIALGVNYHTHATWQCSGSAHRPVVDVDLGVTATYEEPAERKAGQHEYVNSPN